MFLFCFVLFWAIFFLYFLFLIWLNRAIESKERKREIFRINSDNILENKWNRIAENKPIGSNSIAERITELIRQWRNKWHEDIGVAEVRTNQNKRGHIVLDALTDAHRNYAQTWRIFLDMRKKERFIMWLGCYDVTQCDLCRRKCRFEL